MTENTSISVFITNILVNPIPQYLLGILPAILVLGDSPFSTLFSKTMHVFLCLGCPFTGLFYFLNVDTGPSSIDQCVYWLLPKYFHKKQFPFGYNSKKIECSEETQRTLEKCILPTSALERFACAISLYFITVGVFVGIIRAVGPCHVQDWPSIPLLFAWTFPALVSIMIKGKTVGRNPVDELNPVDESNAADEENPENNAIPLIEVVSNSAECTEKIRTKVIAVLFLSIIAHWLAVIITYYTRPIGFGCRSKYLTVISSIWTFNSIACYIVYYLRDRPPPGVDKDNNKLHILFQICGVAIFVLLIGFGVLSHDPSWWVAVFGDSCSVSSCTDETSFNV